VRVAGAARSADAGREQFGDQGGRHVHFALSVPPGGLGAACVRLSELGVEFEGPVGPSGGDRSLYCKDPAGNVLELWDFFHRGQGADGVDALASPSG
jgi:catechol-2,3-dioxygenase